MKPTLPPLFTGTPQRSLDERLDAILPRLQSETFLKQQSISNEIGYHIFDYDPEDEGVVRQYLQQSLLLKNTADFPFLAVNLFELMLTMLADQEYIDGANELEAEDGSEALLEGLKDFLNPAEITQALSERLAPRHRFVLLYGVGEAWPVLRTHELLNNMHATIDRVPVVLFYPGRYALEQLQLFNAFKDDNYYRAFELVPRTSSIQD